MGSSSIGIEVVYEIMKIWKVQINILDLISECNLSS
jgi:hypothetical protein